MIALIGAIVSLGGAYLTAQAQGAKAVDAQVEKLGLSVAALFVGVSTIRNGGPTSSFSLTPLWAVDSLLTIDIVVDYFRAQRAQGRAHVQVGGPDGEVWRVILTTAKRA